MPVASSKNGQRLSSWSRNRIATPSPTRHSRRASLQRAQQPQSGGFALERPSLGRHALRPAPSTLPLVSFPTARPASTLTLRHRHLLAVDRERHIRAPARRAAEEADCTGRRGCCRRRGSSPEGAGSGVQARALKGDRVCPDGGEHGGEHDRKSPGHDEANGQGKEAQSSAMPRARTVRSLPPLADAPARPTARLACIDLSIFVERVPRSKACPGGGL